MRHSDRAVVLAGFLVLALLRPTTGSGGVTVKSITPEGVTLTGADEVVAGAVFEVRNGDDLLGFLLAEDAAQGGPRVRLIAGKATPGAEVIPIGRPATRVGILRGNEGTSVEKELRTLCPGRVIRLQGAEDLAVKKPDAVVITSPVAEEVPRRYVEQGGTAIVDLAVYAAWSGAEPKEIVSDKPPVAEVTAAGNAMRGLAVGQTFRHHGRSGDRYRCRCLAGTRQGGRVLLKLGDGGGPLAVQHDIGRGTLLAVDLLWCDGRPGYDDGSVLKWILPGNLLAHGVRYVKALSERLDYKTYMDLQEQVAARTAGKWVREKIGVDSGGKPIWRFRCGPLDRPILFFDGAIHAGEWLTAYLPLDLIEYLADVPEGDYKARWLLRNYTITVIPMLSGSMRQESASGCDLNRNFDFRWEDYTKGYGWREGRALKLRGPAPFSEPEARVIRDHVWNDPVIGHVNLHMHGLQHGAMLLGPHEIAEPDPATFDAAAHVARANLLDRFLWKGPSQLELPRHIFSGRTVPYATNWVAYQGPWAATIELVGGSDHSLQEKELGFEGLLGFMYAVGVDFAAGKRAWLGCPRTGLARPGGCKDATAMIFTRDGKETIAYRTNRGKGTLRVPLSSDGCRLRDESGGAVEWTAGGDHCVLPMGLARLFFGHPTATREQVIEALKNAKFEPIGDDPVGKIRLN